MKNLVKKIREILTDWEIFFYEKWIWQTFPWFLYNEQEPIVSIRYLRNLFSDMKHALEMYAIQSLEILYAK